MNKVLKAMRHARVAHALLLGTLTFFFVPSCVQPCFAATGAKTSANYLHDGEKTVNPWSRDAKQLAEDRETIEAAKDYIRRDPSDPMNFINRAGANLHLMHPKEAIEDVNHTLALKPKDQSILRAAYCIRGEAQLQLKQYKAALDDLNKACVSEAEDGEAFYFRGMAKEKLGNLSQAVKDYEMARSLGYGQKEIQVDFSEYMTKLQRRIKNNWHPVKADASKRAVVEFRVARDGKVSYLQIHKSSGVAAVDAAAILAVQKAAPFEHLPKGSQRDVGIQFTFDYNVNGTGVVSFLEKVTEQWNNTESEALKKLTDAKKGKDETAVYDAELKLAKIYTTRGKYPAAIDLYQSALQVLEKKPEKLLVYGKTFGHLAMVYSLQGKTAEAETEFKKSLEIVDKDSGYPSDPEVVEILKEYAKVLYKTKKVDEANKIYARLKK